MQTARQAWPRTVEPRFSSLVMTAMWRERGNIVLLETDMAACARSEFEASHLTGSTSESAIDRRSLSRHSLGRGCNKLPFPCRPGLLPNAGGLDAWT